MELFQSLRYSETSPNARRLKMLCKGQKKDWETTFDAISDPIFIHDSELKIVRANMAYKEASGLQWSEIIGRPYYEIFPKMDSPFNGCLKALKLQEEVTTPTGKIYKIRFFPIRINEYKYSIHILEDITEGKKAEANILHLKNVLSATRDINQAIVYERDPDMLLKKILRNPYTDAWL